MGSRWFDFHEDLSSDFFGRPSRLGLIKKKFGTPTSKAEDKDLKSWGSLDDVNDILDFATSKSSFFGNGRLFDSVLKDDLLSRPRFDRAARFAEEPTRFREVDSSDIFSDLNTKARHLRNRMTRERNDSESKTEDRDDRQRREDRRWRRDSRFDSKSSVPEKSSSSSSGCGFTDITNDLNKTVSRRDSSDRSGSVKSAFQGNVTFPTSSSSNVSEASVSFSERSKNSDDSICTEKSANCSSVSEKLSDGTNKTKVENYETWRRKSPGGSRVSEKKQNDSVVTEQNDGKMSETSTKRMSYLEKSATGSSIQEEATTESVTSCDESGMKTVEQKTSSESYKKNFRSTPNKSTFYDELDSCAFQHYARPGSFSKSYKEDDPDRTPVLRRKEYLRSGSKSKNFSDKISRLIDEAVEQDNLFKISSSLQADIDRITDDFLGRRRRGVAHGVSEIMQRKP